jgi:hypothetical protein
LKAHGALVDTNCMEFPNLNFALDWAETQLLNSAYVQQGSFIADKGDESVKSELDARDTSFTKLTKGRKSIRKMEEVTVSLITRTLLGLDKESWEDLDDLNDYCSPLVLEQSEFLFTPGEKSDEFFVLLEGQLVLSMANAHRSKASKGLIINKGENCLLPNECDMTSIYHGYYLYGKWQGLLLATSTLTWDDLVLFSLKPAHVACWQYLSE